MLPDSKESTRKRFLIGAAVLALTTWGAQAAWAKGGHHSSHSYSFKSVSSPSPGNYFKYSTGGKPFNRFSYRGKNFFYGKQRYWYPSYGCYLYWDAGYSSYYYWCGPDGCYYPIGYCPYGRFCW